MKVEFKGFVWVVALMMAVISVVSLASEQDMIAERISPVGSVCIAGDPCAAPAVSSASSSEPRSGQSIFESKCAGCHASGMPSAPQYGDAAAWAVRSEKGLEMLYTNAIKGINGMPAKGLCMDCSDDEIKATVDYILAGSGQ